MSNILDEIPLDRLLPGIGSAMSVGLGMVNLLRANDQMLEAQKQRDKQQKALEQANYKTILSTYPTQGINTPSLYLATGGLIPDKPVYKAEGDEVIMHNPFDQIQTDEHGDVQNLSSDMAKLDGDKHSAPSGGIGVSHQETGFVFSDQIPVPDFILTQLKKYRI